MNFVQYLEANSDVGRQQIVQAFIKQCESTPSFMGLCQDHKWLNESQLYEVVVHQAQKGLDFVSACKELGFWCEDLEQKLKSYVGERRAPYTAVLVESGAITSEDMVKLLEQYLSEYAHSSVPTAESEKVQTPLAEPTAQQSDPGSSSEAANDLEVVLNPKIIDRVNSAVSLLNPSAEYGEVSTELNFIFDTFHEIKGSACLLGFKNLETLADIAETAVDKLREHYIMESSEGVSAVLPQMSVISQELTNLYEHLCKNNSDENFELAQMEATRQALAS